MIERWNGTSWNIVASPSPDSGSYLSSVAVVSANDIWAVGATSTGTLTEQWNGTSWIVVPSPSPDSSSVLRSVAVVSPNDVWAVGYTSSATLTENWTGSSWHVISSPNVSYSSLYSIAVVAANNIWAVGTGSGVTRAKTLTEHWNGTSWTVIPSPNPPSGPVGNELYAVAIVSSNDVWAVGITGTGNAFYSPLMEQWNGTKWKVMPSPSQGDYNPLPGIVTVPGTDHLWAVGSYAFVQGAYHTVTEYYG